MAPRAAGYFVAEREGFEPSVPVKTHTLSRRAPSAARPSLRSQMVFHRVFHLFKQNPDALYASGLRFVCKFPYIKNSQDVVNPYLLLARG